MMQFGLFYEWPNPTLRPWKTLFEEGVEQIQYSEALGFDYCLIAEHHFTTMMGLPGVRAQFGALVHAQADIGKPLSGLQLGLQCMTHVAPTDEEAYEALHAVCPPAELPTQLLEEPLISNEELQARRLGRAPSDMAT